MTDGRKTFRLRVLCLGILGVVCVSLYLNTLAVPFYLDDFDSISNNLTVSGGSLQDVLKAQPMRAVTYASFWADVQLQGVSPRGFHLTNMAIHTVNCWLVFTLAWLLLEPAARTRRTHSTKSKPRTKTLLYVLPALASALLFASHPLHTQAVTYVVQRAASLASLFYLATLILFLFFRGCESAPKRRLYGGFCALSFFAALLSKQSAFSLPLALLLTEGVIVRTDMPRLSRRQFLMLAGGGLLVVLLGWMAASGMSTELAESLDGLTRDARSISRWDYFQAQQAVLLIYLGKFLLPLQLRLEYDLSPGSFSTITILMASAIHLALLGLGVALLNKHRVIAYGIFLYYTGHIIESSVIPIKDLAVEHRSYLPDIGLVLVAGAIVQHLLRQEGRRKAVFAGLTVVLLSLSTLTVQRNLQWRDPIGFYEREYRLSPQHNRVVANLASRQFRAGNKPRALEVLQKRYDELAGKVPAQLSSGFLMLAMETAPERVYPAGNSMLRQLRAPRERLPLLVNLGYYAMREEDYARAEQYLSQAIEIPGCPTNARWSLAIALQRQQRMAEARFQAQQILAKEPGHSGALLVLKETGAR
ncbi:MAG: hypothetical protein ACI87W_000011 [Halieaceae bacterium]|jgi:hypothetical protein